MLYTITPSGVFTPLYTFEAASDGHSTRGQIVPARDGLFYGATTYYGPNGDGAVFTATAKGKFAVIQADVSEPTPLVEAVNGTFYGIDGNYNGTLERRPSLA